MEFAKAGTAFLGATRVALLEAIAQAGSISAAARAVGMSYKGAWDAVEAMNNLSAQALVARSAGGRNGGGTRLTAHGEGLVRGYREMEARTRRLVAELDLEGGDFATVFQHMRRWMVKTSARNQLLGTITEVVRGAVNAEIKLALDGGPLMTAIVTNDAVDDLDLVPGKSALALVKASSVILLVDDGVRSSARNRLRGPIRRVVPGAVNSEVVIDLGGGKSLTAIVTCDSVRELGLAEGMVVTALIKASSIVLAVSD